MNIEKCQLTLLLATTILVAGCAESPYHYPRPSKAPVESRPVPPPKTPDSPKADRPPPSEEIQHGEQSTAPTIGAVDTLIDDAWQLYEQQQYQKAIATAERAQRLDRRHAEIYLVMGRSYLALYEMELAEQLARQGLAFASSGTVVRSRLESLLQQARR